MEHKVFPSFIMKVDDPQGVVEHLVAVMGNRDQGDDVIHPGAFAKTLSERGGKVKVLDLHKTDSIMRVLGKPIALREIGAAELPAEVKAHYPDANGALAATTQFNLRTPEGRGAFERIKAGDITEWSFGYDAINPDYSKSADGKTVRNLREVRLFEYSPVIFAMNDATMTLSAKSADDGAPDEGKPWRAVHEGDKWRVYKLDENGQPTGEALGEFDSQDEAVAQVRALYASEAGADGKADVMKQEEDGEHPASHYLVVEDPEKVTTWHLRVRGMDGKPDHTLMGAAWAALHGGYRGQAYEGPGKDEAISKLTALYNAEEMDVPNKAGRRLKGDMVSMLDEMAKLLNQMRDWANYQDAPLEDSAPADEQAAKTAVTSLPMVAIQAGPATTPPTLEDVMRLIEIEQHELELLEA